MEPPPVLVAQSADPQRETTPVISVPVVTLVVLIVLALITIIYLQVRALFVPLDPIILILSLLYIYSFLSDL